MVDIEIIKSLINFHGTRSCHSKRKRLSDDACDDPTTLSLLFAVGLPLSPSALGADILPCESPFHPPVLFSPRRFLPNSVDAVIRRLGIVYDATVSFFLSFLVDELPPDHGTTCPLEPHSGHVLYRGCNVPLLSQ